MAVQRIVGGCICTILGLAWLILTLSASTSNIDVLVREEKAISSSSDTLCTLVPQPGSPRCASDSNVGGKGVRYYFRECACAVTLEYNISSGTSGYVHAEVLLPIRTSTAKPFPNDEPDELGICEAAVHADPVDNLVTYTPSEDLPWLCSTGRDGYLESYKFSWLHHHSGGNLCTNYSPDDPSDQPSEKCKAPPMAKCLEEPVLGTPLRCSVDAAGQVRLGQKKQLLAQTRALGESESNFGVSGIIGVLVTIGGCIICCTATQPSSGSSYNRLSDRG